MPYPCNKGAAFFSFFKVSVDGAICADGIGKAYELYAMGEVDFREAVLLINENTKLTPEKTIEYFI